MRVSQNGLAFIAREEGLSLNVYDDVAGYKTIGVGHLLTQTELDSGFLVIGGEIVAWDNGLTQEQALDLLAQDIQGTEAIVNALVKVPLNQNQFDALVSFTFNVGSGAFSQSTLLKMLNTGQYDAVPPQMMKWVKAGGRVVDGLVNRRQEESALWESA